MGEHSNVIEGLRAVFCLKDADGEEIYTKQVSLNPRSLNTPLQPLMNVLQLQFGRSLTISPEFSTSDDHFSNMAEYDFSFQISATDYRDIKSMELFLETTKE